MSDNIAGGTGLVPALVFLAACVFLVNLPSVARELRQVRIAPPPRVAEEDALLAPPPPPRPRESPWD